MDPLTLVMRSNLGRNGIRGLVYTDPRDVGSSVSHRLVAGVEFQDGRRFVWPDAKYRGFTMADYGAALTHHAWLFDVPAYRVEHEITSGALVQVEA